MNIDRALAVGRSIASPLPYLLCICIPARSYAVEPANIAETGRKERSDYTGAIRMCSYFTNQMGERPHPTPVILFIKTGPFNPEMK